MMRLARTLVLSFGLVAQTAATQRTATDSSSANDQQICLTVARLWRGSIEDVRRIDEVPVPTSYRQQFEAGGCSRFQLVEGSLIDWHLAFGNERSLTAALLYLERGYITGRPPADRFRSELSRAWRSALRAIQATALPSAHGPEREAAQQRLFARPEIRRAYELSAAHDDFIELTQHFLRAAEYHGSATLLAKAQTYLAAVQAGHEIIFRNAPIAMADFQAEPSNTLRAHAYRINQVHDLDMRVAILRARLTRDPADIDAASAVLSRNFGPVLQTAVNNAQEHSGEFCEFDGEVERADLRALEQACDQENSIGARIVNFWRNRAHLDMLMAADPVHYSPVQRSTDGSTFARLASPEPFAAPRGWLDSFELADRLLRNAPNVLHHPSEQRVLFLLARADLHARLVASARPMSPHARTEQVGLALNYLAQAERIVSPYTAPSMFRRVAETYLRLWDRRATVMDTDWRNVPEWTRLATFFRRTLVDLDAIATAADAGLPALRN